MSSNQPAIGPLPEWDPQFAPVFAAYPDLSEYEPGMEALLAARTAGLSREEVERGGRFRIAGETIAGGAGRTIQLSVLTPTFAAPRGAILWFHSGGMVTGAPLAYDLAPVLDIAEQQCLIVVASSYALGPEHPAPAGVEDALASLKWTIENHRTLGYPEGRLIGHGLSGGAGIAAGMALAARPAGLRYLGLVLDGPMLDDRMNTVSYQQHRAAGTVMAGSMATMWRGALGGSDEAVVEPAAYATPGRLSDSDLSGLPPVFLTCGVNDPFRDETTAFAEGIWRSGGTADLHQWAGVSHGVDSVAPAIHVSQEAAAARAGWYDRILTRARLADPGTG